MIDAPIGVIADDYTGASDVAAALRAEGLSTNLVFGSPDGVGDSVLADAVVVGTKTRNCDPAHASKTATDWLRLLRGLGVGQWYFKYCSTFDSTPRGNIGPVADALLEAISLRQTLVCPASPAHGRTVYQGHLFVGPQLLAESSMYDHPVTPMRDSRLERLLQPQTPNTVGAVRLEKVLEGDASVRGELARLRREGVVHAVADAVTSCHLDTLVAARDDSVLLTGAAGLAAALGRSVASQAVGAELPGTPPAGRSMILAGSCSAATLRQVALAARLFAHRQVSPLDADDPAFLAASVEGWIDEHRSGPEPLLVFCSAPEAERAKSGHVFGDETGAVLERVLGHAARYAVRTAGVDRVIVAGGETSGAVIDALGIRAAAVGAELDPGVPWLWARDGSGLSLVLKSGNFGTDDLLVRAVELGARS